MLAKIKTSSFIRYSEAKITLLALYMSVMKSPKALNWTLEPFVWNYWTDWQTDWLTDWQSNHLTPLCACARGKNALVLQYSVSHKHSKLLDLVDSQCQTECISSPVSTCRPTACNGDWSLPVPSICLNSLANRPWTRPQHRSLSVSARGEYCNCKRSARARDKVWWTRLLPELAWLVFKRLTSDLS